jgi:hypothetical protein
MPDTLAYLDNCPVKPGGEHLSCAGSLTPTEWGLMLHSTWKMVMVSERTPGEPDIGTFRAFDGVEPDAVPLIWLGKTVSAVGGQDLVARKGRLVQWQLMFLEQKLNRLLQPHCCICPASLQPLPPALVIALKMGIRCQGADDEAAPHAQCSLRPKVDSDAKAPQEPPVSIVSQLRPLLPLIAAHIWVNGGDPPPLGLWLSLWDEPCTIAALDAVDGDVDARDELAALLHCADPPRRGLTPVAPMLLDVRRTHPLGHTALNGAGVQPKGVGRGPDLSN